MLTANPYVLDNELYPLVPPADRWIFNKLIAHERLGLPCGPCGTAAPAGDICIRPIMNMHGLASGGFFKVAHSGGFVRNRPGYFWTPWLEGLQEYTYYVNDVPWYVTTGTVDINGRMTVKETDPALAFPMPDILKGISRYMVIETINRVFIEVSPRHSAEDARPKVIADIKTWDPLYDETQLEDYDITGRVTGMKKIDYGQDEWGLIGWRWNLDETTQIPFEDKFAK